MWSSSKTQTELLTKIPFSEATLMNVHNGDPGDANHIRMKLTKAHPGTDDYELNVDASVEKAILSQEGGTRRTAIVMSNAQTDTKTIFGVSTSSNSGVNWNPRLVIRNDGNLGVNVQDPQAKLDVGGNSNFTGNMDLTGNFDVTGNITTSGTVEGRNIAADGVRLDGMQDNATANDTDANLKDRTNHTGTQTSATISDFDASVTGSTHAGRTDNPHVVTKAQVGLADVANLKVKLDGTIAPGITDDANAGFSIGSRWINTVTKKEYVCVDTTVGLAVWTETTGEPESTTAVSVGIGTPIYKQMNGNEVQIRSLGVGSTKASVVLDSDTIRVDVNPENISVTELADIPTSDIVGVDDQQTLQNKELDDDTVVFVDNLDATKKLKFQLSQFTTATTRTIAFPDADDTAVMLSAAQSLTSKVIDADNNNISNIGDEELKSGINATKLANGNVTNEEFQHLDGVTSSIQTQLDTKSPTGHNHTSANISDFNASADARITLQKGQNNGLATLDATGKVPASQLAVTGLNIQGTWNADTNTPTIVSSVGTQGDFYIVETPGSTSIDGIDDWQNGDWIVFTNGTWEKADNSSAVTSVAGKQGAVSLVAADIGDFDDEVGNNPTVAANTAHKNSTSNPHGVTATQVGSATSQWNANKIRNIDVDTTAPQHGQILVYCQQSGKYIPKDPINIETTSYFLDTFIGALNTSWQIQRTDENSYAKVVDARGGQAKILSNAVAGHFAELSTGTRFVANDMRPDIYIRMKLSSPLQTKVNIGLYENSLNSMEFTYDAGAVAANWITKTTNGGNTSSIDTGVVGITNWLTLRLAASSGSTKFYINNTLVSTHTANLTSDLMRIRIRQESKTNVGKFISLDVVKVISDNAGNEGSGGGGESGICTIL